MSALQVLGTGRAGRDGLVVVSRLNGRLCASTARPGPRGSLSLAIVADAGETVAALTARAVEQLAELARIEETLAQPWPRLDGEEPDPSKHWLAAGLTDAEVVEWLEVGIPWASHAKQLRDAGVAPREVGGEWDTDVTLGLAFAIGAVSLAQVLELRRPAREVGR